MTNHPLKENIINLPEEEPSSASNESILEEIEEGIVGPNHLGGKDEEDIQRFHPLEEYHLVKGPLF